MGGELKEIILLIIITRSLNLILLILVVPAAVFRVALSNRLLQLNVEKRQLLPALLLLHLVKDGRVKVIHGVSSFQEEVVPHSLEVFQQPVETPRNSDARYAETKILTHKNPKSDTYL